jgi:uncharacterized protein
MEEENGFRFSPRPNRAAEIKWRHWGADAFREARENGKLVLLSISAVWCHWCHVMDETTYSDSGVIERINRDFVPVRVDSDKRPDINRRYNQGGWPTTAFLVPSGRAIAGLTYAPAEQLAALLDELTAVYRHRKNEIDTEAASEDARERMQFREAVTESEIDPRTTAEVEASILAEWDRGCGGLGDAPKFPACGPLEFAIARYLETGDQELRSFVISTLDGMSLGELYDKVEGGFFRYATSKDWSAPHYEKMLSDNAELIYLYLAASMVFDRSDYAQTARGALDYAIRVLMEDEQRGFFGSQDADESYYHRDAAGRAQLETPAVDRTLYTDSNSLMVSALVLAANALEDPDLLVIARKVSDFIWRTGFRQGAGICHYIELPGETPRLWGQPADQVNFLRAMIDLYQATEEPRFLERAVRLGKIIKEQYVAGPGWVLEPGDAVSDETGSEVPLDGVPLDVPDIVVNGNCARALLALDALIPGNDFDETAKGILGSLAGKYRLYRYFASIYAMGVDLLENGVIEVRIAPNGASEVRREIGKTAASVFNPRKLIRLETVEDYLPTETDAARPPAVVCTPGQCLPVYSAEELRRTLDSLLADDAKEQGAEV